MNFFRAPYIIASICSSISVLLPFKEREANGVMIVKHRVHFEIRSETFQKPFWKLDVLDRKSVV